MNLRIMTALHCYTTNSFAKKSGDGDAESLLSLMSFMPPAIFFFSFYALVVSFRLLVILL
jgi:hypothetical protein